MFPRFLRWVLFVGYKRAIKRTATGNVFDQNYFGLPAKLPGGSIANPDSNGASLDAALGNAFQRSNVLVVVGKGGSGKSTLLMHWFRQGLADKLADNLKNLTAIHVPAADYQSDLVQAASEALRRRFGRPLDRKGDILRQQMAAGGFLVLFDGLSEIEGEKTKSIDDIMRTVRDKEMSACRFVFTTRPVRGIPSEIPTFELLPLSLGMIESIYLPRRADLTPEQRTQIVRQLGMFRDDQIDPLLLTLAIDDSTDVSITETTCGLFTRYFRRLLRVENSDHETLWQAWKFILETFADWFMLSSGKRGIGMQHRQLIQRMTTYEGAGTSLIGMIQAAYGSSFTNENALLEQLAAARILEKGPRWRFRHDLFEEYFVASRIVTLIEDGKPVALSAWTGGSTGDFANVLEFTKALASLPLLDALLEYELPQAWRDILSKEDVRHPHQGSSR